MSEAPSGQAAFNGRIGAAVRWAATEDRVAATAPARKAFDRSFEKQVDPDGVLPPDERAIRAAHARRAYLLRLALKSAQARRKRGTSDLRPPASTLADEGGSAA
ncbi:hypothetical protein CLV35_1273 [Motilibacter peucedani]|uniref:Uncharacterized protein n=1 Tax=Motilibacter peucedani TaxID=598650 RepID=A0A420XRX4_9ACTN|nr:hypothetical protein CLV35_1273 [Motilibacter peucedani]